MAKKDSLLAHCLARAIIAEQGGLEAAAAKYGPNAERLSKWRATALAVKSLASEFKVPIISGGAADALGTPADP